jgi:hypothetical protein
MVFGVCVLLIYMYTVVLTSDFVLVVAAARAQTSTTTHAPLLLSIGAAESSGGRDEV